MTKEPLIATLGKSIGLPYQIDQSNAHIATALLVVLILMVGSLLAWLKLRDTERRTIPSEKLSICSIFEITVEGVLGMMEGLLGKDAPRYLPMIGSLFIYILACNLMGVIPGFAAPTSNINTNLACAVCVFVYYNYVGIRKQGVLKYIRHMAGPVLWLAPLMLTIEVVSHLVRPISLSIRLFGNMTGDHMVLEIFSDLVPLLIPIVFMGLTIFVAFIQAFVFSLLSILYIALATQGEEY